MSSIPHLLITKLHAPLPRPDLVERQRLIQRLDAGVRQRHRLYLVSAPAGYGKTTLIVDWLNGGSSPFNWLTLDNDDNDLQRFFSYLIAALQQIDPAVGGSTATLLASPDLPSAGALATTLINDIATARTPFFLVLDDYHTITAPAIHEAVTFLLDHQPPQLRLVLSTREEPPLPLARLRGKGFLTELHANDLRFTHEEATTFFRRTMGLDLHAKAVEVFGEQTEGWIAGLQLAGLSIQGLDEAQVAEFVAAFGGGHSFVVDYLFSEVLRRQTRDTRDFLRQTAFLDRLSASLCDAVTGQGDSRGLLTHLERANLFLIPLDSQREWYRYHHLFAEALNIESQHDPGQQRILHARAARWFEAHGFEQDAIKHALAAEAWDEAGRLIKQAADQALGRFELGVLSGWLGRLPDDVVRADPELATLKGWVTYHTGQSAVSRGVVAALDRVTPEQLPARTWARLVSLRAVLAIETPEAPRLVQEALALTGEGDPIFRQYNLLTLGLTQQLSGQTTAASETYGEAVRLGRTLRAPAFTIHAVHDLAITLIKGLRRHEAQTLCEGERRRWVDARGNTLPILDLLLLPLAVAAYEANDLIQARDLALAGREAKRRLHQQHVVGVECEQILIRAYAGLGEWEQAWRIIHEVRQAVPTYSWFVSHTARIEADLLLRQGNIKAAEQWAETAQVSLHEQPGERREPQYLSYARLLLAQRRPRDAHLVLSRLPGPMQAGGRLARLITVFILQALAEAALDHSDSARRLLVDACQLAAPEGYSRRFLVEGPAVAGLLPAVRAIEPAFVDELLRAFGEAESRPPGLHPAPSVSQQPLPEPLTEQELTVLRLLAEGLSYQGIAERLVVTQSTAKWHVLNIYGKLGVHNRTQALNRAHEVGLL